MKPKSAEGYGVMPGFRRLTVARLLLALVVTTLVAAAVASPVRAQQKEWRINEMDVVLDVQENGDVFVSETVTFDFRGPFTFVGRVIPTEGLEGLTDFQVSRDGQALPQGSGPGAWQTFQEGDDRVIQVNFELADTSATWTFQYRAVGAIHFFDEGDELRWYVFDAETPVPIDAVRATVLLPGSVGADSLSGAVQTGPSVASDFGSPEPSTLVFEGSAIPPYTEFWVVAGFPNGLVEYVWTPRRMAAFLAPKVGFALPIITFLIMLIVWRARGRDADEAEYAGYVAEPPSGLPPGVAGALVDEKVEVREVVATIVDLARRGYLEIEEEKEGAWIFGKTVTYFRRLKSFDDLREFERAVGDALFSGYKDTISSEDLKDDFYQHIDGIVGKCYEEVTDRGFFARNPSTSRRLWFSLGVIYGVALLLLAGLLMSMEIGGWGFFGAGAIVSMLIVLGFSRVMPQRTPRGVREQRRWEAFRNYLKDLDRFRDQASARERFEAYLPYAVAFGVEKEWVRRFNDLQVPAPPWYHPVPRGGWGDDRVGPNRPIHMPAGGGDLGGGGLPGGGLSLESISDNLFSSLNNVSDVLTSRPAKSGGKAFGGGGGSFGGGFSGGGGGGGFRAG